MSTRKEYVEAAGGEMRAITFESQVLSIGSEFLPQEAQDVRDGRIKHPSGAYWAFLIEQLGGVGS
jgi:hypothetical protein